MKKAELARPAFCFLILSGQIFLTFGQNAVAGLGGKVRSRTGIGFTPGSLCFASQTGFPRQASCSALRSCSAVRFPDAASPFRRLGYGGHTWKSNTFSPDNL
jgi:hypothetical protein